MNRPNVAAAPAQRPSRILLVLAAAWLIAAMAIGGLSLESVAQAAAPATSLSPERPTRLADRGSWDGRLDGP